MKQSLTIFNVFIIVVFLFYSCDKETTISGIEIEYDTTVVLEDTFKCCLNTSVWEVEIGKVGSYYFWEDSLFYICSGSFDGPFPMETVLRSKTTWRLNSGDYYNLKMRVDLNKCLYLNSSNRFIGVLCNGEKKLGLGYCVTTAGELKYEDDNYDCTPSYGYTNDASSCFGMHDYEFIISQDSVSYYVDDEHIYTSYRTTDCQDYIREFRLLILVTGYSADTCLGIETISLTKHYCTELLTAMIK